MKTMNWRSDDELTMAEDQEEPFHTDNEDVEEYMI